MNTVDIVNRLREHARLKEKQKEIRVELIKFAVECGMDQAEAQTLDVLNFFDGYLFALGHVQPWRENKATAS